MTSVSRRDFLRASAAVGGGLVIAAQIGCEPRGQEASGPAATPFLPNAWVRVSTDGSVTVVVDRSEMGQGVLTALPQLVAEELDADWATVRVEQSPAGPAYYNALFGIQGTGGSSSVRAAWQPLREAGAKARAMLIAAAAQQWGVTPDQCSTEAGFVIQTGTSKRLGYGKLADAASKLPVPEKITLKDTKDFRIIGKSIARLDLPDKVVGRARFGLDVTIDGLLVAIVARSPAYGGKPAKWDEAAAKAIPGVKHVVQITSGIAVIADGYWNALKGIEALAVQWDAGRMAGVSSQTIARQLLALTGKPGIVARKEGNPAVRGVKTVEAVYEAPYLAHACMEPMNATAHVEADKCTVWVPTQYQAGGGAGVLEVAAKIAGVPVEKVTVHTTLLGGGFGRRFNQDFVEDAVEASKAAGAPVKVVYSREDDIAHDFYRPISTVRLTAQLDATGAPIVWQARVASPPTMPPAKGQIDPASVEGFANLPYAIPNILVDAHNPDLGVPCGFWRSVGSSQNGFFVEGFMDELAAAAGKDPVEYRRALLEKSPRHKRVLEMAAEKSGWGTPLPAGRARGVAMVESFGTFVAEVAEVSIEKGFPRVHRVVVVMDCGPVVNPDIVAAQVEGAIVMGLSAALYEEITIDGGKAVQTNFDSYRLLGLREMPVVEVHLVPSTEPVTGVGEPATPPIAPAVVNAIAVLTGKRIRRLPLTREFPLA